MRVRALLLVTVLGASACAGESTGDPAASSPSSSVDATSDATSDPMSDPTSPPDPGTMSSTIPVEPEFAGRLGEPFAEFAEPVDLVAYDGRTYIVERGGVISLFDAGVRGDIVLDVSDLTVAEGERGLLGLAFSPGFAYVNYTELDGDTVIDRYTLDDEGRLDRDSRTQLLTVGQPYPNHNGGDIVFDADTDSLLVFTGDGGAGGDPERLALDTGSLLGKILRLRHPGAADTPTPITPEIAAAGLRNPWRVSIDEPSGLLYIADVGQGDWEEVSRIALADLDGASFGWSAFEGTHAFNADQAGANESFTYVPPFHEYSHADGNCSISGGAVYRGEAVPVSGDWYVYADFCSGDVRAVAILDGAVADVVAVGNVAQAVAVLPDADGELWVLSLDGSVVPMVAV